MRLIEFRAWDKENKIMIDDYLQDSSIWDQYNLPPGYCIHRVVWNIGYYYQTLMQFTGLLDCEDKKIFEGDILELDDKWLKLIESRRKNVLVGFHEGSFMFGRSNITDYMNSYLWMSSKYCKIIGNIHQNPELLEQ